MLLTSFSNKKNFFLLPRITTKIIMINVAFFLIFSVLISLKLLPVEYIAIKPSNILQGRYLWTFITNIFMHAGFFHIFVNMISLFFLGSIIEKIIGTKRYLYFYILSGIFAGIFFVFSSLLITTDFNSFAVGSSGAIFGLVGLLVLLTPNLPVYVLFIPISIKMKYAGPGMLILLWIVSLFGNIPIGNTAHLGGLISGLIYGLYLRTKYKKKTAYISKLFS